MARSHITRTVKPNATKSSGLPGKALNASSVSGVAVVAVGVGAGDGDGEGEGLGDEDDEVDEDDEDVEDDVGVGVGVGAGVGSTREDDGATRCTQAPVTVKEPPLCVEIAATKTAK